MKNKPLVFISYSHKDEIWKDRLKPHLDALEMAEKIVVWDDKKIDGGDKWYSKIENTLSRAAVAVCLISEHYLASKFCVKEEIPYLLDRAQEKNMLFIPVLLSPCPWKAFRWLKETQMLPGFGKSIVKDFRDTWSVPFAEVADLIFNKINDPDYHLPAATIKWTPPEKIDTHRLPDTGDKLFGREKELGQLDEAWKSADTNIISFIAWGGVGKSTLINKWLDYMKADNFKDAERVFAWSFYSQGTSERVTSADSFISESLKWFGDPDPTTGSAWEKGQRLAGLIRQKKTLLILDGMEPLQSPHKFEKGKIKDQGLASLLRALALNNNGLCIITSREIVADIAKYKQKVEQINLDILSVNAGTALLRVGGVQGTDKELEAAVKKFGYHALAIKMLPVYLRAIKGHHISDALQIPGLKKIPVKKGKHPRKVIEALSQRFTDTPEGDLLHILGLFDRPADIAVIKKIIDPPVIEKLTGNLCTAGETGLLKAINTLRNENLLAKESKHNPDTLDCHPLIREHFGEKLEQQNPDAWKQAHLRLYDYYKDLPEKELPDTLEEMEPLFAAVMHGCLAGEYNKTEYEVYFQRVYRENEKFIVHKLGAFGTDLSCLSGFFERLWDKPATKLTEHRKAVVLSWAGYALRALGRLSEAAQPMKAGLEMYIESKHWQFSAITASNVSELYLTLGDLVLAQKYGAQSVIFADRSGDVDWKETARCREADALHRAGNNEAAEKLFIEAETMQKKRRHKYPWLFSYQGFLYCDLLISLGKYQEVLKRANYAIKIITTTPLLDFGFNSLSIGKTLTLQSVDNNSSDFNVADVYLNKAVNGLRETGDLPRLPRGLFARAALFRHKKEFLKSWADLDEAHEIAEYGQMRLHLTDYHLEAARVIEKQLSAVSGQQSGKEHQVIVDGETLSLSKKKMQTKFKEHVKEAERLIGETGYHRRDGELEELKKKV